ncbi:MAG TPA: tripartite tricarboxylate transporter substrate binding protein [Roseateles sp.]|uniref:tripartite tricarboxylate transporter substrate binding protein n=1 Tax=Roseateles sp. TaxID=1971397 RepID=UPI002ED8326F
MNKRRFLLAAGLAGLGLHAAARSAAADPLKVIVATPAGGASDTAARIVAQALASQSGRQVMVENRPGGNGVPAVQALLTAPPDGKTLLWASGSMAGLPILVRSSPLKSMNELTPVAPVMNLVYGLFVNPRIPARTVEEFGAYLRAHPDQLSYATGVLSEYMAAVAYLRAAGARALRVPYKGGAQLLPDLIAGEVQFNIGPLAPALPHVRSGRLRLLATLPDRSEAVPDVPAMAEAGLAVEALPSWNGLVAPPHTPPDVVARLAEGVNRVLAGPGLRHTLEAQGLRVTGGTPEQLAEAIDTATQTWRRFVREHDIPQE